jgi:hypothetical protein
LLLHWKTLIEHAIDDAFLIYDLSDQYIGAFHLEKFNFKGRPYWRTTRKSTADLTGSGVSKDISLAELKSKTGVSTLIFLYKAIVKFYSKALTGVWRIYESTLIQLKSDPLNVF